ncbi:eIF2A-related protein [Thiovibrio sp. JS02]
MGFLLVMVSLLFAVFPPLVSAATSPDLLKILQGHQSNTINAVACSADGQKIASGDDDGGIRVWDLGTGNPLLSLGEDLRSVRALAFSPDGQFLAAATVAGRRGHAVQIWDLANGQLLHDMREHTQLINDLAWSPDGKRIASVSNDNTLRIWNLRYGTLETTEKQTGNNILSLAWSPDGRKIVATENWDGIIEMWDAVNVRLANSFKGHADWALCVAYSPDGTQFVTGSRDGSVHVWDAETGKLVKVLRDPELDAVNAVAYSPDGRHVTAATQSQRILVWQSASGKLVNFYEGHQLSVTDLSFVVSGRYLVSAGLDGTVRIWNGPGQGGPESLYAQAFKYENGVDPMGKDAAEAAKLYRQAAEKGNAEAQYRLGLMYSLGDGVAQSREEARKLWALAAEQGNAAAKAELEGGQQPDRVLASPPPVVEEAKATPVEVKTIEPEEKKARPAQTHAPARQAQVAKVAVPSSPASMGKDKEALYDDGMKLFKGEGVAKDHARAFKLFSQAAEMGHAKAQYRLGFMYSLGRGVRKDDKQAVHWWRKAAGQNDPDAQYYLGYMHEIGAGVKQDLAEAKQWYQKAAANGSINAVQSLKMLP